MNSMIPYLIFPGNCEEALNFYKECLDGDIFFLHTFAEAPFEVPEPFRKRIFNSEIRFGDVRLRASDNLPPNETVSGNNMSLFVTFNERSQQKSAFEKLSRGGNITIPLVGNFGMLTDPFGIQWMIVFDGDGTE